jgi:hypothetical protein
MAACNRIVWQYISFPETGGLTIKQTRQSPRLATLERQEKPEWIKGSVN